MTLLLKKLAMAIVWSFSRYNYHLLGSSVMLNLLVVEESLHEFIMSMPFTIIEAKLMLVIITIPPRWTVHIVQIRRCQHGNSFC